VCYPFGSGESSTKSGVQDCDRSLRSYTVVPDRDEEASVRFAERLEAVSKRNNSLLCVGLDPDIRRFPTHLRTDASAIISFNREIIEATADLVCAYKPNLGFYMAYGPAGIEALAETRRMIDRSIPVILDAKVGDFNVTSEAYARGYFGSLDVDAITVHPYMGLDGIEPFLCHEERAAFILVRTSNPGSKAIQDLDIDGAPLYQRVASWVADWQSQYGTCGAVVGATWPDELAEVRRICPDLPILIPGVGPQGGDLEAAVKAGLDASGGGTLISSSRGIIYAGEGRDFARSARVAAQSLRDQINEIRASW
jgi:orotidine-5'-phosphate decarboxylase